MELNIRMATVNDVKNLIKARFDYFEAERWEVSPEQHSVIKSNLLQYFTKHLNIDFFAAIAEENDKIISLAFLSISEKPANLSFPTGKIGTILNVLTYPEYRKKGFATQTLGLLIAEAKRQNLSYIELSASESGKPLYQKIGFREIKSSHFTEMKMSLI